LTFEVSKAFPPDGDSPIAEICTRVDGELNALAVVFERDGVVMIKIFERDGAVAWEYGLRDVLIAIDLAKDLLKPA
jgi:hypothetical protein